MKRMEPLNRDELLALLKAARESSTRDWCLLVLMCLSVPQPSECVAVPNQRLPDVQEARQDRQPARPQILATCPEAFARARPTR